MLVVYAELQSLFSETQVHFVWMGVELQNKVLGLSNRERPPGVFVCNKAKNST